MTKPIVANKHTAIHLDINGYFIRIVPTKQLISCNIETALDLDITVYDGIFPAPLLYVDGDFHVFYRYAQFIKMCKIKNKIIPEVLHQYLYTQDEPKIELLPAVDEDTKTMSSLDIAELTGKAHKNVLVDIKKIISELGDELKIQPIFYVDKMNRKQECYSLDRESALLVTSGYSAALRLKIIRRLDELESAKPIAIEVAAPALPTSYKDALLMLAQKVGETEELAAENERLVKTKMQIGSKREATAMSTAGVMAKKIKMLENRLQSFTSNGQYATIIAIQSRVPGTKLNGVKLSYYCNRHGLVMKDIPDDKYGKIHSYPAKAWKDVYNIDITSILGV